MDTIKDDELYNRFLDGDTSSYDQLMIIHGENLIFYIYGSDKDVIRGQHANKQSE